MLYGSQQGADGMRRCSGPEVFCRDVQIDLRAGDLPMTEQVANGHEPYALAHEVGRKRVAHAVR